MVLGHGLVGVQETVPRPPFTYSFFVTYFFWFHCEIIEDLTSVFKTTSYTIIGSRTIYLVGKNSIDH